MTGAQSCDVVIVTRNHAGPLPACLESLRRLDPAPSRVVVVDNASSDASVEVAAGFANRLPLEVVELDRNTGFTGGFNTAMTRCSAPWILSLNPDAVPHPSFVADLLRGVVDYGEGRVGSATGRLLRGEGRSLEPKAVIDAAGMIVLPSGRHLDRGAGEPDRGTYGSPAWVFGGTGAATLFFREALDDVAYPDGEFMAGNMFAYREDAELAWRLQWRGWRCLYMPSAVAVHARGFQPEHGRRGHRDVNRLSVRNRFLLRAHCADVRWHIACLPWWLLRDLAVVTACLTVETSSAPALADLVRKRRGALRRRRWVLGRATASSAAVRRWFRRGGLVEPVEAA